MQITCARIVWYARLLMAHACDQRSIRTVVQAPSALRLTAVFECTCVSAQDLWFPQTRTGQCYAPCICGPNPKVCSGRQYIGSRDSLSWRSVRLPLTTPPALTIGYGSDLFAIPLSLLGDVRGFFECVISYHELLAHHDDYWISAYLQMRHNVSVNLANVPESERDPRVYIKRRRTPAMKVRDMRLSLRDSKDLRAIHAACAEHFYQLRDCVSLRPHHIPQRDAGAQAQSRQHSSIWV